MCAPWAATTWTAIAIENIPVEIQEIWVNLYLLCYKRWNSEGSAVTVSKIVLKGSTYLTVHLWLITAVYKLKSHKSPGIDQIPAELIKEGGRTIRYQIHKLIFLFGIKRNCLRSGRSRSLYLSIRRGIKQIVITIGAYHFWQLHTKFCPTSFSQG